MFSTEHINIKFTIKHLLEIISFLDVEIKINNIAIETWPYRKPINTNLFLNFNASEMFHQMKV